MPQTQTNMALGLLANLDNLENPMYSLRLTLRAALMLCLLALPALAAEQTVAPTPAHNTSSAASNAAPNQATPESIIPRGSILETMNSGGYTYLLLDAGQEKIWVALPETPVSVGQTVACMPGILMQQFSSKTLNRSFERIVFSPGLSDDNPTADKPAAVSPHGGEQKAAKTAPVTSFNEALQAEHASGNKVTPLAAGENGTATESSAGSRGAVVPPSAEVKVAKASGANSYSVGECFAQGKALHDKSIRVQGKVMKISRMIMGKNWLHIQDGSGDPQRNEHDLVVTTNAEAREGAIVTIEGLLHVDRDFGAGYTYKVIVEDAKVEDQSAKP